MSDVLVNTRIRAETVRIVDENGNQLGVYALRTAIAMASGDGFDLIQLQGGVIPVCRFGDAGKYAFERQKHQRELAKRQRELQVDIKEIQLRPGTDTNDILVKARRASEFLAAGDKVKIVVRFRGRERANRAMGRKIIDEFLLNVTEYKMERPVADSGKELSLVISPTKSKAEIIREKQS